MAGSDAALAPQLRRWCWCSAGRPGRRAPRTLSPLPAAGPPPRRPFLLRFPAPGFAAANRAAAAGPGDRFPRRDWRAEREESSVPAWVGCKGRAAAQTPIPRCWDRGRGPGTRGGSRRRPVARAGLKEARCRRCHHHRSGPGPSVQPSLPSLPVRRCPQLGAPPARLPAGEWEGDGAPPPAVTESTASPSTPVAARRGAMRGQGLAQNRPFIWLLCRGDRRLARGELRGVPALLSDPIPTAPVEILSPLAASLARQPGVGAVRGEWSQLLFPGCCRAAPPEN